MVPFPDFKLLALLRRKFRVADLKVAPRDEHPLFEEVEGDKAERRACGPDAGIGERHDGAEEEEREVRGEVFG